MYDNLFYNVLVVEALNRYLRHFRIFHLPQFTDFRQLVEILVLKVLIGSIDMKLLA